MFPVNTTIQAGATFTAHSAGDYAVLRRSTGTVELRAVGKDKTYSLPECGQGEGVQNAPFERVELLNNGAVAVTVTLMIGQTANIVSNPTEGSVSATIAAANGTNSPANATVGVAASVITAPAGARGVILTAASTNAGIIYVGSTVAGRGTPLNASGAIILEPYSGNVDVIASMAAQSLSITWLTRT